MKFITLGALLLFGFICLYQVKHKVSDQIQKNTALLRSIHNTDKEFRLLKADWAYLNRPQRLEPLAHQLLGLAPIAPSQIQEMP